MSTCSTCRPFQLNRSPDYPMTHNARRLRCPTRIHALGEVARAPLILVRPSPSALLCASFHHAIVVDRLPGMQPFADHCGPPNNSRHVKAIPGILLIVMQSRYAAGQRKPNGIIILSRSRQCRGRRAKCPVSFDARNVCDRGAGRRSLEFSARSKRSMVLMVEILLRRSKM